VPAANQLVNQKKSRRASRAARGPEADSPDLLLTSTILETANRYGAFWTVDADYLLRYLLMQARHSDAGFDGERHCEGEQREQGAGR
jgi:hypothetical protein